MRTTTTTSSTTTITSTGVSGCFVLAISAMRSFLRLSYLGKPMGKWQQTRRLEMHERRDWRHAGIDKHSDNSHLSGLLQLANAVFANRLAPAPAVIPVASVGSLRHRPSI
jgi:hypothetical protein